MTLKEAGSVEDEPVSETTLEIAAFFGFFVGFRDLRDSGEALSS